MSGQDVGKAPKEFWGDSDYEYWVNVPCNQKDYLLLILIQEQFAGDPKAVSRFSDFLDKHGIKSEFGSWI
jgi:hypothetical protein